MIKSAFFFHATSNADSNIKYRASLLFNTLNQYELNQYYPHHHSKDYSLDLLFGHIDCSISTLDIPDNLIDTDSHHDPVLIQISPKESMETLDYIGQRSKFRNYYKADFSSINSYFDAVNWTTLLNSEDINVNVTKFHDIVNHAIDSYVPFQSSKSAVYPAWYDHDLVQLTDNKRYMHCKWKSEGDVNDFIEFKKLRALCIRQSRIKYNKYLSSIQSSIISNPKKFWSYINNLNASGSIPKHLFFNS